MKGFVISLLAFFAGAASAQTDVTSDGPVRDVRQLLEGAGIRHGDSLYREFRDYQEIRGFTAEPIVEGESLADLLVRLGVGRDDADAAAAEFFAASELDAVEPGTPVRVKLAPLVATPFQVAAGTAVRGLEAFEILEGRDQLITVYRAESGFVSEARMVDLEVRYVGAAGEINRSIFDAGANAGVPRELMIRFADVFAFDVDFAREIYRGDRFEIVYELLYDVDGRPITAGEIVFAALTWRGQNEAKGYYRFEHAGRDRASYYDATGRDPRTLLMRSPINGARVTSRFGRRRHPVLGYTQGHEGVDFGADRGTPVLAAGDGLVSVIGPRGTFGNYIRIDHSEGYQTAYAHLDRFAADLKRGAKVKQGQLIGYVGSTGRSTGPHLHYEVRKEGNPINPESATAAVGETLDGETRNNFVAHRDQYDDYRIKPLTVVAAKATKP